MRPPCGLWVQRATRALVLLASGLSFSSASTVPPENLPWREPGQGVSAEYLRKGTLRYTAENREIVGRDRTGFNNRPLYGEPRASGLVLAGDRPFVRFCANPFVYGGFAAGIIRGGEGKWFYDCDEIESRYRCGRMTWRVADSSLPAVEAILSVIPLAKVPGFGARLKVKGLRSGDRLVWAFGGARSDSNVRGNWDPIMWGNPSVHKTGDPRKPAFSLAFDPPSCRGNQVHIEDQTFWLSPTNGVAQVAVGRLDRAGKVFPADASACSNPARLIETAPDQLPMVCGVIELQPGEDEVFWEVTIVPGPPADAGQPQTGTQPIKATLESMTIVDPVQAYHDGIAYLEGIERVQVDTPEPRLDAAVAAVCHPIDASCDLNPILFRHGCMAFCIPFIGWRVIFGAMALGWHERVKGDAEYYIAAQVKDDPNRTQPSPDPARRYCLEGDRSRLYGRGRIARDQNMYNTQSQFFDQVIHDWRWTADPELERILRPALELHLDWVKDCFDPDDDGLYESYIDTLPTDSVWYNGGGSVEESAYTYYGQLAAMDMARRAGDTEAASRHRAEAEKPIQALKSVLWLKDQGHFGLYLEQGGHRRVHSDAWVYSQFLPIDTGMASPDEALQALYYTEWGLERIRLPFDGVLCQPSNWVPSKWSVRDMFGGDMFHLALAYFQTGLGDDGWELLLGAMLESAYAGSVPGGFSHIGAGTDFSDNCHMFARSVVEGLFGYSPDYPNDLVRIRPAFPSSWPRASIRTPDFTFDYRQAGRIDGYKLTLARAAEVEFRLPVRAERVRRITLDGKPFPVRIEAGFGCTWVVLRTPKLEKAEIEIGIDDRLPRDTAIAIAGKAGDVVRLSVPRGEILDWQDLHHVLEGARVDVRAIVGRLARKTGHHLLLANVKAGGLPRKQVFKIEVADPEAEARIAAQTPRQAPKTAAWKCFDLAPFYNGDVRAIFKQQYLSPRPRTCSLRLGADGYSAWTFAYWGDLPPAIDLVNLDKLAQDKGQIVTPQNALFTRFATEKNIAFTSLWDNWPRSVTVPINQEAEAVWMLVCGSTFPMQTRIPNAEVRFRYADGRTEKLELVPPLNFWSLCPWGGVDYNYELDAYCLPKEPPPMVQLGNNCRTMVLSWKLRSGSKLEGVTLETLSQDVVIGLMGLSLMNPR
ncbi:MAG: DUF4450 domain-containing protein [Candidatus Omnitrophica bacterium]|nr:DUF4450 domain-containing protein [Candidatus Omnitrophota bacterium]